MVQLNNITEENVYIKHVSTKCPSP
jgi:hypothetical protein